MRTVSTIIATLLTLAMLVIILMALTGNLPGIGANTGHPPVNGFAVAMAQVNKAPAPLPEINANTIGTAAAGELPGIGTINTTLNADIATTIGAKK